MSGQRKPQGALAALDDPLVVLLKDAEKTYPFIKQYSPLLSLGRGDGYAETWPATEEGDPSYPRPAEFPIGRTGVQVFRPDAFGPSDLAAEFLHVDPLANQTRSQLLQSLTAQQLDQLKRSSADYTETIRMGEPESKALSNAADSAMRGYTVGQWPAEANAAMGYSPDQKAMLDALKSYMTYGRPK